MRHLVRDDGFTLTELVVVAVIIGFLASITIATLMRERERAWTAAAESDARNAMVALESAFIHTGGYGDGEAGRALDGTVSVTPSGSLAELKSSLGVTTRADVVGGSYCIVARHANSPLVDRVWIPSNSIMERGVAAPVGTACAFAAPAVLP